MEEQEQELLNQLTTKLNTRGIKVTWLSDLVEHKWVYNTNIRNEDLFGIDTDLKTVDVLMRQVINPIELLARPIGCDDECGSGLTLMLHTVTSNGRKFLYYNAECLAHGIRQDEIIGFSF
jgi:hypothetical protein